MYMQVALQEPLKWNKPKIKKKQSDARVSSLGLKAAYQRLCRKYDRLYEDYQYLKLNCTPTTQFRRRRKCERLAPSAQEITDRFFALLDGTDESQKKAGGLAQDYTRNKLRSENFLEQILPAQELTRADLEILPNEPMKVIFKEPGTPKDIKLPHGKLPELKKVAGPCYLTGSRDSDPVNHPSHYTAHASGVECIQVTEWMNFCIGNAVKCLWRSGIKAKDPIEDLEKAKWYIQREIDRLKKAKNSGLVFE